jgi:hypothetical protein
VIEKGVSRVGVARWTGGDKKGELGNNFPMYLDMAEIGHLNVFVPKMALG